jgi:hypothetical protein
MVFWLITLLAVLTPGLSGCSKERVYRNVYEGVRMKDGADHQPANPERMPTYDAYQRDRQDIIEDNETM